MATNIKDPYKPYQRSTPPISAPIAPISAHLPDGSTPYQPTYTPASTEVLEVIKKIVSPNDTFLSAEAVCSWIEAGIREPWQSGMSEHEKAILSSWYYNFQKKYHKSDLRRQIYAGIGAKKTLAESIYDRAIVQK